MGTNIFSELGSNSIFIVCTAVRYCFISAFSPRTGAGWCCAGARPSAPDYCRRRAACGRRGDAAAELPRGLCYLFAVRERRPAED